jgi:actin-related protein
MDAMAIDVASLKDVIRTYKEQGQATVTTVEVIQEYHLNNRKADISAANRSFNSLFGKLLREHEEDLGIRYVREVIMHDHDISVVQSAEWVIL